MNKLKLYFLYAVIAGFIYMLPHEAFSVSEIEFHVTNNPGAKNACSVTGRSREIRRECSSAQNGGMTYFYSAEVTEFSPYGPWFCSLYQVDSCFLLGSEPELTTGIVVPAGTPLVDLIISEEQGLPVIIQRFTVPGARERQRSLRRFHARRRPSHGERGQGYVQNQGGGRGPGNDQARRRPLGRPHRVAC